MSSLFKTDIIFGHVVEDTDNGPVYQDDRTPVLRDSLRPCLGCAAACKPGEPDPCIADLPKTLNACCGHGRDFADYRVSGYVAFEDGRTIRFSGLVGGARIKEVVTAFLKGEALPEGFTLDADKAWWHGLSERQRAYVESNMDRGLAELVRQASGAAEPSEKILSGEAAWWDGLTDQEKEYVWNRIEQMLAELVSEALATDPLATDP